MADLMDVSDFTIDLAENSEFSIDIILPDKEEINLGTVLDTNLIALVDLDNFVIQDQNNANIPSNAQTITFFIEGSVMPGDMILAYQAIFNFNIEKDCLNSLAHVSIAPSGDTFILKLLKNTTVFGSLTFNPNSLEGVFESTKTLFNSGDMLYIRADTIKQTTVSNLSVNLMTNKT